MAGEAAGCPEPDSLAEVAKAVLESWAGTEAGAVHSEVEVALEAHSLESTEGLPDSDSDLEETEAEAAAGARLPGRLAETPEVPEALESRSM